jgi:hypothetical protein
MLSFKNFLTELIKNEIGEDKKLPHSTKFDPKGEHAGYEKESVETNTDHVIYTNTSPQFENDEPGYVHHIWVHPKTGHIDLSVEADTKVHKNGRVTYNSIYTRGRERIEGSQNNSPSNMAAHGYNDLHKHFAVITQHESQSPGAQKIQTSLRKLYPETNPIYYNNETGESYPISHVRPFMKPSGNRKPWPLARHAFNTDLSVSSEELSKHGKRQLRFNRRHHLLLQDE